MTAPDYTARARELCETGDAYECKTCRSIASALARADADGYRRGVEDAKADERRAVLLTLKGLNFDAACAALVQFRCSLAPGHGGEYHRTNVGPIQMTWPIESSIKGADRG